MREQIINTIIRIIIVIVTIFLLYEVVIKEPKETQQSNPAAAADSKEKDGQYIPKDLNYSRVIKKIKSEEGVSDSKDEQAYRTAQGGENPESPESNILTAVKYVKEAMETEDEGQKKGKVIKALHFYKEYLKYYPGDIEGLLGAGTMATYLGKEEEAKNILMEAYATYPNNPAVHKALGDYSFKFANYNNAIEYYNLSLNSGNMEDYATNLAVAVCYEKLGDIEEAITYYKVAQYLNPNSDLANRRLEMYAKMAKDGYEADTRKYEAAEKIPEEEDTELQDLLFDASQIK